MTYTLAEIESLLAGTTEGEWKIEWCKYYPDVPNYLLAGDVPIIETDGGTYPPEKGDALFLAASKTIVKELLEEVKRLKAERDGPWGVSTRHACRRRERLRLESKEGER